MVFFCISGDKTVQSLAVSILGMCAAARGAWSIHKEACSGVWKALEEAGPESQGQTTAAGVQKQTGKENLKSKMKYKRVYNKEAG